MSDISCCVTTKEGINLANLPYVPTVGTEIYLSDCIENVLNPEDYYSDDFLDFIKEYGDKYYVITKIHIDYRFFRKAKPVIFAIAEEIKEEKIGGN